MSGHQNPTLEDTVFFGFGANDTSGSGGDGASPLFDVRLGGAAASAAPVHSGTPDLLTNAAYPAGSYEVAVAATAANGFAAGNTYLVYCTLAIDSQNPTGFIGSFTLTPLATAAALATVDANIDTLLDALVLQATTIATLASQTSFTLTAGSADNDAYNGAKIVIVDQTTGVQRAFGSLSDYAGSTRTVTLAQDPGIFTMATGDIVYILPSDVFAIWDRLLTGATHNIAASAGRRLRGLQDFGNYLGSVHIDTVNGVAGTVIDENGTAENPVDTLADAITINTTANYNAFLMSPGSSITLAQTFNNFVFEGKDSWVLALGGQDIADTTFKEAEISGIGTGTGTQHFHTCTMGAVTLPADSHINIGSTIVGTQTLPVGDIFYAGCHSGIAGTGAPQFDFGAAIGNTNLNIRDYSGGVDLRNMGQVGTDVASIEGNGQLIINVNCIGGTIVLRGMWQVTDNSGGAVTIIRDDNSDAIQITGVELSAQAVDDIWDEPLTGLTHNVVDSSGRRIRDLQEFGSYEGGAIWIDTVNGTAGTTDYESGTAFNPVDSIADANTLATSLGLIRFAVAPGSSVTFAAAQTGQLFNAHGVTLALGGQDIDESHFFGVSVSGIGLAATEVDFHGCEVGTISIQNAEFEDSTFTGTVTMTLAGDYLFINCQSGATTPTFTKTAGQAITAEWRRWSDGGTFSGIEAGDSLVISGTLGDIVLNGADGTVEIRGVYKSITDNRTGSPTLNRDGAIKGSDVADILARTMTAANLVKVEASVGTNVIGAAEAGTLSTTQMTSDLAEATDDHYIGRTVIWTSGVLANQASDITDYLGSTGMLSFTAVTEAPSAGDPFVIV